MDVFFCPILPNTACRGKRLLLAFSWVLGLFAGAVCAIMSGNSLSSMMRTAASGSVSIVSLMSAVLLPLLFSAFAVYISQIWLLFPLAFGKAFLFSFLGVGLMTAYGSAGWLVRCLFMFSDCLILPVLWLYWLRSLEGWNRFSIRNATTAFLTAGIIGSFDYYVVSPFLASLL